MAGTRKHLFALRYPNHEPIYLDRFGSEFVITGLILQGKKGYTLMVFLPDQRATDNQDWIYPTRDEWIQILKQLDDPEQFEMEPDGKTVKAIHRKATRSIDQRTKWFVFKRAGYKCEYCQNDNTPLTIDHYVPVELGGTDEISNLMACCSKCNRRKANMSPAEWEKYMKEKGMR